MQVLNIVKLEVGASGAVAGSNHEKDKSACRDLEDKYEEGLQQEIINTQFSMVTDAA